MNNVIGVDILAIAVHPDDAELAFGGTMLKHIALGYTVGLLDLTLGELGTRGSAEIRTQEAFAAAIQLQAKFRLQLNIGDCFFEYNKENIISIAKVIRQTKPKIVLANAISDRHPDHGRAAKLISDSCFYSGLIKLKTQWEDQAQQAHRPAVIYHGIQDRHLAPDFVVDIDEFIEAKMDLVKCFKSQFYDPNSSEPESAISTASFLETVKAQARIYGRLIQSEFGEGFTVERPMGIKNLFELK